MKSIFSAAVVTTAIVACLSLNVQAKTVNHLPATTVSDTGKMAKDKMGKMPASKTSKKKVSNDKMSKKKMSKDTASKM